MVLGFGKLMIYKIKKIWSPEIFQGYGKKTSYFEGWYYKLVDQSGENVCAIIPGIIFSNEDSHSFVQILYGQTNRAVYHRFSIEQFWASKKELELRIGENVFRKDSIQLELNPAENKISGQIQMSGLTPWPVTIASPGIMGWYAYMPFMECYHGVVSLDHQLNGSLIINGEPISFDGGRGYTEKDWGKSFPSAYIWMQCNHFDKPGISLTVSIANIPWLRGSFRGFIIGFLYQGKLYRFATYTKATVKKVRVTDKQASLLIFDKNFVLKISAERSEGGLLHAPYEKEMQSRVLQSLTGEISIEFRRKDKNGEELIYSGTGHHAGMEINGNLSEIID